MVYRNMCDDISYMVKEAEKALAELPKVNGLAEVMQATGEKSYKQESTLKKRCG